MHEIQDVQYGRRKGLRLVLSMELHESSDSARCAVHSKFHPPACSTPSLKAPRGKCFDMDVLCAHVLIAALQSQCGEVRKQDQSAMLA